MKTDKCMSSKGIINFTVATQLLLGSLFKLRVFATQKKQNIMQSYDSESYLPLVDIKILQSSVVYHTGRRETQERLYAASNSRRFLNVGYPASTSSICHASLNVRAKYDTFYKTCFIRLIPL